MFQQIRNEEDPDRKHYYKYRAKLDSLINLLDNDTENSFDQDQHPLAPPFDFPVEFSLKRNTLIPFTNEPILMDASVATALEYIKTETPKLGTMTYAVPPCAISSMARSGKTTLLHSIFNRLLQDGEFNPILVNFNGARGLQQPFRRLDGESDYDAFLRWLATSLLFDDEETVTTGTCQEQDLDEYLSRSELPIVLLVDELNALTLNNASDELAQLLRQMFLDKPGRYLCFTSHWFMDLGEVVGNTESFRGTNFVKVSSAQNEEGISLLSQMTGATRVQRTGRRVCGRCGSSCFNSP